MRIVKGMKFFRAHVPNGHFDFISQMGGTIVMAIRFWRGATSSKTIRIFMTVMPRSCVDVLFYEDICETDDNNTIFTN